MSQVCVCERERERESDIICHWEAKNFPVEYSFTIVDPREEIKVPFLSDRLHYVIEAVKVDWRKLVL